MFTGKKLVVATHNAGKLREIESILALPGIAFISAGSLHLPEPEETGTTFAENARLKAVAAQRSSGLPSLADDSGLCVAALNNAPGVYSARWAGPKKNFASAMEKIRAHLAEKQLETSPAAFVAALCLALPDGRLIEVEGRVDGTLTFPPRGTNGFGYDPIFVPENGTQTFGEMLPQEKEKLSHRARAVAALKKKLLS